MIFAGELASVEHGELDLDGALVCAHMEEELLVPEKVQGVSDYARAEGFFAKGDDNKRVHVLACVRHYNQNKPNVSQSVACKG
jgi:hypothetical protein